MFKKLNTNFTELLTLVTRSDKSVFGKEGD